MGELHAGYWLLFGLCLLPHLFIAAHGFCRFLYRMGYWPIKERD